MSSLHIPPFGGRAPTRRGGGRGGISQADVGGGVAIGDPSSGRWGDIGTGGNGKTAPIAIGGGGGRGGPRGAAAAAAATAAAVAEEGKAVSRQLSRSYFVPRSLEGYERHLRQIHCEGYLQRQSRTTGTWRRRWFLLKDGYLSYFHDQEEAEEFRSKDGSSQFHHHPSSQRQLSLDCVEAVRTEEKLGPLVFRVISSHRDDLVLRAESKEDMNDWLFGFHRALASIIARVIENKNGAGFCVSGAMRGGGGGGGGGQQGLDRLSRGGGFGDGGDDGGDCGGDPFRVGGDTEIRKVLGHGHGRSRRLSLRHYRMNSFGGRGRVLRGPTTYGGYANGQQGSSQRHHNGRSAPHINSVTTGGDGGRGGGGVPLAASALGGGGEGAAEEEAARGSGGGGDFSPAFDPAAAARAAAGSSNNSSGVNLPVAGPLHPPHEQSGGAASGAGQRFTPFLCDERRRRTESLGCYIDGGGGHGYGYGYGCAASPSSRDYGQQDIYNGVDADGQGEGGNTDCYDSVDTGVHNAQGYVLGTGGAAATAVSKHSLGGGGGGGVFGMGVGGGTGFALSRAMSAGCEPLGGEADLVDQLDYACQDRARVCEQQERIESGGPLQGRSISAQGATGGDGGRGYCSSEEEDRSSESGHGSTSDEGVMAEVGLALTSQEAMGLGLGMNVEPHSLLAAAAAQEVTAKYVPPAARGKFGGGGGGGGGKYVPPAMRAAARAEAAAAAAAAAAGASGGGRATPTQADERVPEDLGAMDMDLGFPGDSAAESASSATPPPDFPASAGFTGHACPASPPAPPSASNFGGGGGNGHVGPLGGGGVGLGTSRASGGYPWAPAKKEHYYTGEYHTRRPCDPEGRCNIRGGGCGGGPIAVAGCSSGTTQQTSSAGMMDEAFSVGDPDPAADFFAHSASAAAAAAVPAGEAGGEGLWWSCGAWSIMGRREKQEDRFCVMPDYTKSVARQFLDESSSLGGGLDETSSGGGGGGTGGTSGSEAVLDPDPDKLFSCSSSTASAASGPAPPAPASPPPSGAPESAALLSSQVSPTGKLLLSSCLGCPTPLAGGRDTGWDAAGLEESASVSQAGAAVGAAGDGVGGGVGLAQGYFGVYDGHCGSEAVQYVRDRLHAMVCEHPSFWKEPERAMREAFLSLDDKFLTLAGEREWYSGSTVLVALMRGRKLLIGNLGDGEAVLCRGDDFVHMSPVHNPARTCEKDRILQANGWITTERELFLRQLKQMDLDDPQIRMAATEHVRWTTITRVCGELSVSRSIGDRDFKGFTRRRLEQGTSGVAPLDMPVLFAWPHGHSGEFHDDLLTAEPEFQETEIGLDDEFLLMACDGLWDVLGKTEAVDHAKNFFDEGMCAQAVAERMCELAYRMGTSDNVTVVIVQFHHFRPPC